MRKPISVGEYSYPLTITTVSGSSMAEVVDTYSGQISTIDFGHGYGVKPISLGATTFPLQIGVLP